MADGTVAGATEPGATGAGATEPGTTESGATGPAATVVRLEPWGSGGLELLRRTNVPELMEFLGGPESEEKLQDRHHRYLAGWTDGTSRMFRIVLPDAPDGVGAIGYWPILWNGEEVYESGWSVEPGHQGKGIATAALRLVLADAAALPREPAAPGVARSEEGHPQAHMAFRSAVHAFPKIVNIPSNVICRKAGFTLAGECEFEYPPGNPIRSHDWVFVFDH